MQRVHFQVRVGVFNCEKILEKNVFRYLWYCGKKQIERGLAWSASGHHSGQNVLWNHSVR